MNKIDHKIDSQILNGIPETLLIPLWARSVETRQSKPVLRDDKAVELVESLDFDFDRIAQSGLRAVEICIRAALIDRFVSNFLNEVPHATIVEIGPGLDTRYERLDNGNAAWWELDLQEPMAVRQRLFAETARRRFLVGSVLDSDWLDVVANTNPEAVLFLAEGVFYYLSQQDLIALFKRLANRFPGSSIVFDSQSRFFLGMTNRTNRAAGMAELNWYLNRVKELEAWDARFRVLENAGFGDSPYYDDLMHRMSWHVRWARRLYPPLCECFRITRLQLGEAVHIH